MQVPKLASKVVLGGGVVSMGALFTIIAWKVDPVQAQLNRLEDRTTSSILRVEGKLDALILLQLGGSKDAVRELLQEIKDEQQRPGGR